MINDAPVNETTHVGVQPIATMRFVVVSCRHAYSTNVMNVYSVYEKKVSVKAFVILLTFSVKLHLRDTVRPYVGPSVS